MERVHSSEPVARSPLGPALIASALSALYCVALAVLAGDPFILVTPGEQFAPPDLRDHLYSSSGYDGQFTFYLARHGLESGPYLDLPAYRAQRMLLPFIARLLWHGGDAPLIWILVLVNAAGLFGATWCLAWLLERRQANRWFAFSVALSLGMFGAVRMGTSEPLAFGFALAGLALADGRRWGAAGIGFALAALARETTLLFPLACAAALLSQRREWSRAARVLLPSVLAFLGWQLVLYQTFDAVGAGSGGADSTGFEWVPLWGFVGPLVRLIGLGDPARAAVLAMLMGAFVVFPAMWALLRIPSIRRHPNSWSHADWLLLAHLAVILSAPASTFTEPLGMLRLVTGFQVAFVLCAAEQRLGPALRYSLFWVATLLVLVSPDLHRVLP